MTSIKNKLRTKMFLCLYSAFFVFFLIPTTGVLAATATFRLFPNLKCTTDTLTCWIGEVFSWSQTAILLLATVVIVFAGLTYMTSAGSEKQIALAKRLILGALSGVAVVVLGRFFLTVVIGVPWL